MYTVEIYDKEFGFFTRNLETDFAGLLIWLAGLEASTSMCAARRVAEQADRSSTALSGCTCIVLRLQPWELAYRVQPDGTIRHDPECPAMAGRG